jgi:alpha-mannosidase
MIQKDRYLRELLFVAKDVPALGYKTYKVATTTRTETPPKVDNAELMIEPSSLANEFYNITFDHQTGWLKSIFSKLTGKEILNGPGNELQILEDKPAAWDAWNIGLTGVKYPSKFVGEEMIENGPVRVVFRLKHEYLKPGVKKEFPTEDFPTSFFTQDIILYNGIDRIDFTTNADWWEEKTMLKVAFPLMFTDTVATYEIPYGSIRRSTRLRDSWEKAKVEVPAQRWADVSTQDYGVSLLNKSKYGYDIKGNVMRLSLLRSPKWPDPLADRGKHSIEYTLYYHKGRVADGNTVRRGYEINNPLIPVFTDVHKGSLPLQESFVSLRPSNLVLTSIKKAEDSDAWIIQWYEANGSDATAELLLPKAPKKVMLTNTMEEDGKEIPFARNVVIVETKKNALKTVKVIF